MTCRTPTIVADNADDRSTNSRACARPAGGLIKMTLSTVGKQFSETPRSYAEIDAYADAMADMFCAYLVAVAKS